jgi:hypothetical protein
VKEALRYLGNARAILRTASVEDNTYTDGKPVQEACGTAYLAVLKAIDEYLVKKGIDEKELPQSVDGYRDMLQKYLMIHNGIWGSDINDCLRDSKSFSFFAPLNISTTTIPHETISSF